MTEATLRQLLEAAWERGWRDRGAYSNKPLGSRLSDKPKLKAEHVRAALALAAKVLR